VKKTEGRPLKPQRFFAEQYHVIGQLLKVCMLLALAASIAEAEGTHPSIPRHHPHAAESRSPHAAEKHHPHAAGEHAKPKKPPKHTVAAHQDPPKAAKH
jgi:hypothetical protein